MKNRKLLLLFIELLSACTLALGVTTASLYFECNELRLANETAQSTITAQQHTIDGLKEDIEQLNEKIDDKDSEISGLNSQIAKLRSRSAASSILAPRSDYSSNTHQAGSYYAGPYIGNKSTHVFHRKDCSYLPSFENREYYGARIQAIMDNMRPCEHCNP